jgi:hypothetical protein
LSYFGEGAWECGERREYDRRGTVVSPRHKCTGDYYYRYRNAGHSTARSFSPCVLERLGGEKKSIIFLSSVERRRGIAKIEEKKLVIKTQYISDCYSIFKSTIYTVYV